ncbi:hypothetical protein [Gimesia sp.]|uniref:hypothetical protein n=1 Tax=Gimesia sp. TaxID=2024833 RepID=UPI003A90DD08
MLLCLIPSLVYAEQRTWTSADGKNEVRGELLGTTDKVVILKKQSDGTLHVVPFSMLSEADQAYVREKYPQIFPEDQNRPAVSTTTNETKTASPEMQGQKTSEKKQDPEDMRFKWEHVSKILPRFQPMLIDGAAVISPRTQLISRKQQANLQISADYIGAILCYLADREGYELLAQKLKEKGVVGAFNTTTGDDRERIEQCYSLFGKLYKLFYSKEENRKYYDLRHSGVNDFDQGIQISKLVRKFDQDFQQIKYQGEEIPVAVFTGASLDHYREGIGEFPLHVRGSIRPLEIGGKNSLKLIYLNSPDLPTGIKKTPAEAREFARAIEGKEFAFRTDLVLKYPRYEQNPDVLESYNDLLMNAKIVGLSLVNAAKPSQVIQKWELEKPVEITGEQPEADEQGLVQKMQSLAKEHQLVLWGDYPAVRVDLPYSSDGPIVGSDPDRFTRLLDRVALGLDPNHLSPVLIATHFPETIGRFITVSTNRVGGIRTAKWFGENEFDKRASQQKFEQTYADKLRHYAVELPIRFVEIQKVVLGKNGNYDFERGGVLIDHRVVNGRFPGLTTCSFNLRAEQIDRRTRPCFVQEFLPLTTEQARPLFSGVQQGYDLPAYVTRVVTWDRLQLEEYQDEQLPPVSVSRESFELYRDPQLKQHIASLESKQVPPPVLSEAKGKILPGSDQPLALDQSTLFFLKQEADGINAEEDELKKLFDDYRYHTKSYSSTVSDALRELTGAEEEYSRYGTVRNGYSAGTPEEKQQAIQKWKEAQAKVNQLFQQPQSSFFPASIDQRDLDERQFPVLREKWQKWMRQCIDSTKRHFVVHAEVKLDQQLRDVQLMISRQNLPNPYTWSPAKTLIDEGVPASHLVVLNYQDSNMVISHTPCLQLTQPLEDVLDRVPDQIRDLIIDQQNGTARVELVVAVGKTTLLPHTDENRRGGLLLETEVKQLRLFTDRKYNRELIFEVELNPVADSTKTGSVSVLRSKTAAPDAEEMQQTKSEKVEAWTPAASLRLIARYLPEFTRENSGVLMFNRWRQETDFLSKRDQSKYGIVPDRGLYFRSQTSAPTVQQLNVEGKAFVQWLNRPESLPGSRYSLRFETKFADLSDEVKGYRQALVSVREFDGSMQYSQIMFHIGSEIKRAKRSIETNKYMEKNFPERPKSGGGGFGGSGGSLGLGKQPTDSSQTVQVSEKNKKILQEIEELTRLEQYLSSAPPVFILRDIGNQYGLTNLRGNLQAYGTSSLEEERLQKIYEPIFPTLNMSHQIVLPTGLQIKPGNRKWEVEVEFDVKSATSQETPPDLFDPKLSGKYSDKLSRKDHGKYALFDVEVTAAWLINQQTGKRAHELKLVPYPQHVKQAAD